MQKTCNRCGQVKEESKFPERGSMCSPCCAIRTRARLKIDMFRNLGYACVCCGEDNPAFLSLDHINGRGTQRKNSSEDGYRVAKQEGWPKDKYQILCMNCNTAKYRYGDCPHRLGKTSGQILSEIQALADDIRNYGVTPLEKTRTLEEVAESLGVNPEQFKVFLKASEQKVQ